MHMTMQAKHLLEGGQKRRKTVCVKGPLPPRLEDGSQGGVGEDNQGEGGVQAGQLGGQPAALVLAQGEGGAVGRGLQGGIQADDMHAGETMSEPGAAEQAAPSG
jgi:hypothetical protein